MAALAAVFVAARPAGKTAGADLERTPRFLKAEPFHAFPDGGVLRRDGIGDAVVLPAAAKETGCCSSREVGFRAAGARFQEVDDQLARGVERIRGVDLGKGGF